jgi:hypothetical protein
VRHRPSHLGRGLGANNPVDEVEDEASKIWCSETRDPKPLAKYFISIGTGNPGKKPFEDVSELRCAGPCDLEALKPEGLCGSMW